VKGSVTRFFEENSFGFTPDVRDEIHLEAAVKKVSDKGDYLDWEVLECDWRDVVRSRGLLAVEGVECSDDFVDGDELCWWSWRWSWRVVWRRVRVGLWKMDGH